MTVSQSNSTDVPSSPEDGNFRRSLQIDMKGLVGDAVGNMSISPGSRDVVLAARKGLFIIDLENPLNVPRFLPQGGTWDVADVQWNPHPARKEYIVSTSSEKLLIWNLYVSGKTSIEYILRSHYRAITDLNWHTTDPDIVISTGIDSWLWAWDLRSTSKPVMGLCAFNAGGTQVKWNRQDGNLLASSHTNEVLIWDRRKGSLPVTRIKAHGAKIYGIDWAHHKRNEIVTCSLDKTIKIWDISTLSNTEHQEPSYTIHTTYPIWRARNLPFGQGVLSLPQRGETALEMWTPKDQFEPAERFEGHADVVKEFVWRKGGQGNNEFQLITWSKDRTLRFWPIEPEVMQRVGSIKPDKAQEQPQYFDERISFSNAPTGIDQPPTLSAPVGHRSILAEVRAQPVRPKTTFTRNSQDIISTRASSQGAGKQTPTGQSASKDRGSTMSRGYIGGRSAQITTFAWLSSITVGNKRDGSSGPPSGGESGPVSRVGSRSRPVSVIDPSMSVNASRTNSGSRDRNDEDGRDTETNQSLKEEITSVVNKLTASKVKLEKAELTKKRTCTFGLYGPWGESTSVFIRITFTFPKDYPAASHPGGTPTVELERSPLIALKDRIFILRHLRAIRERQRPCLETCLRFLLFGDENADDRGPTMDDSESSDDELAAIPRRVKEGAFAQLRGDKNLAEPRTSQGVFGPNGELVCFFRAPPRIVRNMLQEHSSSPAPGPRALDPTPRLFWSPILLSDAMRRLALAANDREVQSLDVRRAEDAHSIMRIMSNLFAFSHQKVRRVSDQSRPSLDDAPNSYSLLPTRRSTVFIKDASAFVGMDIIAAQEYVFPSDDSVAVCKKNAEIARMRGRYDHERIFSMLQVFMVELQDSNGGVAATSVYSLRNPLIFSMMEKLYAQLASQKDIQMLAMLSTVVLRIVGDAGPSTITPSPRRPSGLDYFSFKQQPLSLSRRSSQSPIWARTSPSPGGAVNAPAMSSPTSSRGSWSSLFNATSMRRFINASRPAGMSALGSRTPYSPHSPISREFRRERDSPSPVVPGQRSMLDSAIDLSSPKNVVSFPSGAASIPGVSRVRRPTFSQVVSARTEEKKRIVAEIVPRMKQAWSFTLHSTTRRQLEAHIWAYAEMLLAWDLPHKRAELLRSTADEILPVPLPPTLEDCLGANPLGIARTCALCGHLNEPSAETCSACSGRLLSERCSVCRLPIKGLSHTCVACLHASHISCCKGRKDLPCATGCGCHCSDPQPSDTQNSRTVLPWNTARYPVNIESYHDSL